MTGCTSCSSRGARPMNRCRCFAASATPTPVGRRRGAASMRSCALSAVARRRDNVAMPVSRDREATKARILGAVGIVLARDGFAALGVNALAKEAGVDKVLIYRYFGGLAELITQWGASGRFWPRVEDLLGDNPKAFLRLPAAERYARFFEHFVDALRERP